MAKNEIATNSNAPDLDFIKSLGMGALEDLGQGDIIMPRYKLVQNTSKKGTPGKWVSNVSDEELDKLQMALLAIGNYQIYFPAAGEGDKPLCRSNDGVTKSSPDGIGDSSCKNCRYNVWTKDAQGNPVPPKCRSGYSILGFVMDHESKAYNIGIVSIKGAAMRSAKQYFTKMKGLGSAPFTYITEFTAQSVVNSKGRFYQAQMDWVGDPTKPETFYLPKPLIMELAEQSKNYLTYVGTSAMVDYEVETDERPMSQGAQDFVNSLGQKGNPGDQGEAFNF